MATIDDIDKLTNKGKNNPFKVPDDYFVHLQQNIMSAISDKPAKVVAMKPRHSFLRPAVAVAASVVVAVCGIAIWFDDSTIDKEITLANSIEFNEMLNDADGASNYLMLNTEDFPILFNNKLNTCYAKIIINSLPCYILAINCGTGARSKK